MRRAGRYAQIGGGILVGDPKRFAIESGVTRAFAELSFRALGFFTLHIAGSGYGVRAPEATMLACSFDEVGARIARRGTHSATFGEAPALEVARAIQGAFFDPNPRCAEFFGLERSRFERNIVESHVWWAPDGDAAFDDGSNVVQFDLGPAVRVIAWRGGTADSDFEPTDLREVRLPADDFYGLLRQWLRSFEHERRAALKQAG